MSSSSSSSGGTSGSSSTRPPKVTHSSRPPMPPPSPLREDAVQLTVHRINNLPQTMQQLDPNRVSFELVVNATVKYYLEKNGQLQPGSVARMEMPALTVPFSPSSILFRREKFSVDFENLRAVSGENSMSSKEKESVSVVSPSNSVLWRYPIPPPHVIIIYEIFVGVKERRVGSSTSSWVAAGGVPQHTGSASDPQGFRFLVLAESVMVGKIATRLVGLSIGQVALTITVPPPDSSAYNTQNVLTRAASLLSTLPSNAVDLEAEIQKCRRSEAGGNIDEVQLYTNIRKATKPDFYKRRIEKLLNLYNFDNPNNPARVQALLQEWTGREEYMVKHVVMELGTELSAILPRHRMTAFQKKYRLNEQDVAFAFPKGQYSSLALEQETEEIFENLSRKYGNEPRPTSYLFPPVAYEPDRRTYLLEHLVFPVNKPTKNSRDIALTARQKRVPFIQSPNEREISKQSRSGRQLSEIEILQDKHDPEFKQIIPAVADSLVSVIAQHTQLNRPKDERFSLFETNNAPGIQLEDYIQRIASFTYISPASMLSAAIFLDRLCERYPSLTLSDRNVFKLFFLSVRISSKVVDLRSLNNKNFSSVGGVSNKHLNELEDAFLKYIKFDLYLGPPEFSEYSRRLSLPISHSSVPRRLGSSNAVDENEKPQSSPTKDQS